MRSRALARFISAFSSGFGTVSLGVVGYFWGILGNLEMIREHLSGGGVVILSSASGTIS